MSLTAHFLTENQYHHTSPSKSKNTIHLLLARPFFLFHISANHKRSSVYADQTWYHLALCNKKRNFRLSQKITSSTYVMYVECSCIQTLLFTRHGSWIRISSWIKLDLQPVSTRKRNLGCWRWSGLSEILGERMRFIPKKVLMIHLWKTFGRILDRGLFFGQATSRIDLSLEAWQRQHALESSRRFLWRTQLKFWMDTSILVEYYVIIKILARCDFWINR